MLETRDFVLTAIEVICLTIRKNAIDALKSVKNAPLVVAALAKIVFLNVRRVSLVAMIVSKHA